ncbi:MAG TPA: hypothetical protein VK009_21480 [Chloroflexota bacterium]|nr:hypothetical protein [Chloroflexota bacterium]
MSLNSRVIGLAAGLIGAGLAASPALAQVSPSPLVVHNPPLSDAQIAAFSASVGINATCTRAYLAASNNTLPQSLSQLTDFMTLAPAADLCSPGAVASAMNNTPAPTPAQIAAYAQSVGVNATCIQAFVLHANSLPTSLAELNQFQLLAPSTDLCTPATVSSAQR